MCAVASFLGVSVLPSSILVDVVACVTWLTVVDDALSDQCCLLVSMGHFLVDGNLPLVACWLRELL